MPSPIAHRKQSVVLVVISLFLLGCVVPSAVGSTIDIGRQSEDNKGLSKHNTTRKGKKGGEIRQPGTLLPLPAGHRADITGN